MHSCNISFTLVYFNIPTFILKGENCSIYMACHLSLIVIILLMVFIGSGTGTNDKKDATSIRKVTLSPLLPTTQRLKKKRQRNGQRSSKISPVNQIHGKRVLVKKTKKVKNGAQTRHLRKKEKTELGSKKEKAFVKRKTLRQDYKKKSLLKKTRDKNNPIKKAPKRRIFKKPRRKSRLRKKSRPEKDDFAVKNNIQQDQANVLVEKRLENETPDINSPKYRKNRTLFYLEHTPEEYRAYDKCEKTAPRIIVGPWKKLHDGHVPSGFADCKYEMSQLFDAILSKSGMSEKEKIEEWNRFQRSVMAQQGRPKKCKQWRYGSDCV